MSDLAKCGFIAPGFMTSRAVGRITDTLPEGRVSDIQQESPALW
jgi:hypothetical protein